MITRFVIDFEEMDDLTAGGLGLWLQMMLDETEHRVQKLSYQKIFEQKVDS